MAGKRQRDWIREPEIANVNGLDPLRGATTLKGVRVYDVGQGDGLAVLDQDGKPCLLLDYGGLQGRPFDSSDVDRVMPVQKDGLLMLTHWDLDHWCSASLGTAARTARWLVPRQITSPSAVKFSRSVPHIHCVPESRVGLASYFSASQGDRVYWEKIAHAPPWTATDEDCNHSGVALSVVSARDNSVILLPGDASFDRVSHYWQHYHNGLELRGVVAFHHGSGLHWSSATEQLLEDWAKRSGSRPDVVFSCARPNTHKHPDDAKYRRLLPKATFRYTADKKGPYIDLSF